MRIVPFIAALALLPQIAPAQTAPHEIVSARYAGPTRAYDHGILGDKTEYTKLILRVSPGRQRVVIDVGVGHVFEDIAPRLADLDGDGRPEVITVRTNMERGASLAIYGPDGLITQTPPIGQRYRWLAPVGVGDFDGDGRVEIAYIETPHLGKTLKIYNYLSRTLVLTASVGGLSNHRIGEGFISGGVRNCGQGDEIITADAGWQRIMRTRVANGVLTSQAIGATSGSAAFERALACR
ncbi:MAG: VCBS repeat-containing protein [Rhodobacteraceae bacterium]|nr:VCBS repeat-containing protein [Paracoccaceae bacterium]